MNKIYACIDLKSFYASVECVERGLDSLTTNLVVADPSRTEKTICLAVTPALKQYGLSGRSRLFEVVAKVKEINRERRKKITRNFTGKSWDDNELKKNKYLELDYIAAPPRMKYYMKYSSKIYSIYLKYFSSEDIYVYSIDEVFIDITNYLKYYNLNPKKLITKIILEIYSTTGIAATGGIGTNMYLAKIAMDILAKHVKPNSEGVRIACLDVMTYRKSLWGHKPLKDFWRVGPGISKKLEANGIYTMGDLALASLQDENKLFKLFGVGAEFLIDHAWGYEPCTIKDVKNYKPSSKSLTSGQVLHCPYDYKKTKIVVKEMVDLLVLDMVEKKYVTDQIVLTIGYDIENLKDDNIASIYKGEITTNHYGRKVPKSAHGTIRLDRKTASNKIISDATMKLFDRIINKDLLTRRINLVVCNLEADESFEKKEGYQQLDLFNNQEESVKKKDEEIKKEKEDKKIQQAILEIKSKYGKNSVLKALDLEEGATTIDRNNQVGGHKA
jgi:DNA polymerase V